MPTKSLFLPFHVTFEHPTLKIPCEASVDALGRLTVDMTPEACDSGEYIDDSDKLLRWCEQVHGKGREYRPVINASEARQVLRKHGVTEWTEVAS